MRNWEIVTSYSSFEFLNKTPGAPGSVNPDSVAKPLPGFALCGGGGVTHAGSVGGLFVVFRAYTTNNPLPADGSPRPVRILEHHSNKPSPQSQLRIMRIIPTPHMQWALKFNQVYQFPHHYNRVITRIDSEQADSTGSESPFEPTEGN